MRPDQRYKADRLRKIPVRGWFDILRKAVINAAQKNLSLVAAGVAYYLLLALFPALAALVSIYGLLTNPADILKHVQSLSGMLPSSTLRLISDELQQFVSASSKSLGLGALVGSAVAFWSGLNGMTGMMSALDIAYGHPERRGLFRFYVTGILLTSVVISGGLVAVVLVAGLPVVMSGMQTSGPARWVGLGIEWPFLIVFVMGAITLVYRYGPDHDNTKWRFASPGVIVATILWIVGSSLFSFYVYHFNSYNRAYGSLGALLVLLTWLWLSAFVVLFGAEINGEAERRIKQAAKAGTKSPQNTGAG